MLELWVIFVVLSAVIFVAGSKLSIKADDVATKAKIGGLSIGVFALPIITSLPELVIGIRAATIDAVDLALGNLFGSNMLNLASILLIDIFSGKKHLTRKIQQGHILTGGLYISMAGVALLGMNMEWFFSLGPIGLDSFIIALIYISTFRFISRDQKRLAADIAEISNIKERKEDETKKEKVGYKDILTFVIAGVVVILAARGLADTGDMIAAKSGLDETMFGSIFVALSTTLPEIVIISTAARIGAVDMAVGNILGANLLNLGLIFLVDVFYLPGPLLSTAAHGHQISAIISIIMTAILIIGVSYYTKRSIFGIGIDTILIVIMYCMGLISLIF